MLSASPPKRNCTKGRPSSISMRAAINELSPIPPYSSGVSTPKKPDCFAFSCSALSSSREKPRSPRRSRSSTCGSSGMSSLVTNVRTHSRISRSSSVRVRSMLATVPTPSRGYADRSAEEGSDGGPPARGRRPPPRARRHPLRVGRVAHVAELHHHGRDVGEVEGAEVGAEVEAVAAGEVVRDPQPDTTQGGPGVEGHPARRLEDVVGPGSAVGRGDHVEPPRPGGEGPVAVDADLEVGGQRVAV